MRDWERQHVNPQSPLSTHPFPAVVDAVPSNAETPVGWANPTDNHFDEEDDIQIVSGDLPSDGQSESRSLAADSEYGMDLDPTDDHFCGVSIGYGSPGDSSPSGRSGYASASEDDLPPLCLSSTNSACSSQISFPSYHQASPAVPSPPSHSTAVPTSSYEASPSEKAIAALTLVMASGAGGLNDYEAVRVSDEQQSSLDVSSFGEMWH